MGACSAKHNVPSTYMEESFPNTTKASRKTISSSSARTLSNKITQKKETDDFECEFDETLEKKAAVFEKINVSKEHFIPAVRANVSSKYEVSDCIGKGSQGKVYKAIDKETKIERAVKVIKIDENKFDDSYLNESVLLRHLDHPNIIKFYEGIQCDDKFCLVTDMCKGGCLLTHVNQSKMLSERDAAHVMKAVLSSLSYLHDKNIVHRDIKLENILLESKPEYVNGSAKLANVDIKLIDFALANIKTPGVNMTNRCGTVTYMAPEVITKNYDEKCDVWSCGIVLYGMLMKRLPYDGVHDKDILRKVLSNKVDFERSVYPLSAKAKDLVMCLLEKNPAKRISAKDALNHEWIKENTEVQEKSVACDTQWLNKVTERCSTYANKKNLLLYSAYKLDTCEETLKCSNTYKVMDVDQDGKLSVEDLKQFFAKYNSAGLNAEKIAEKSKFLVNFFDMNESGVLEFSEFMAAFLCEKNSSVINKRISEAAILYSKMSEENSLKVLRDSTLTASSEVFIGGNNGWNRIVDNIIREKGREALKNSAYLHFL